MHLSWYLLQTRRSPRCSLFFFFNDTATTEIYTLSLHDALPICARASQTSTISSTPTEALSTQRRTKSKRSEEHTSELQSHSDLVCRLLLEKKKIIPERILNGVCRHRTNEAMISYRSMLELYEHD